jgi:hypothetical protein
VAKKRKSNISKIKKLVSGLSHSSKKGKGKMSRMQSLFIVGAGTKSKTKVRYY